METQLETPLETRPAAPTPASRRSPSPAPRTPSATRSAPPRPESWGRPSVCRRMSVTSYCRSVRHVPDPATLPVGHPTAVAFLDETGSISRDRFFSVGCLVLPEPSVVLRRIQKLRDVHHWYVEMKWVDVTETSYPLYRDALEIVSGADARYACLVADRDAADPVVRFGSTWSAYEGLATQLLVAASRPRELISVLADNYSTPDDVVFEVDVRRDVNLRLGRLALVSVCRLDSRSSDGLQLVDALTGAVTFEDRQAAGLAGRRSAKARLAEDLRRFHGVTSLVGGFRSARLNVDVYRGSAAPGDAIGRPSRDD